MVCAELRGMRMTNKAMARPKYTQFLVVNIHDLLKGDDDQFWPSFRFKQVRRYHSPSRVHGGKEQWNSACFSVVAAGKRRASSETLLHDDVQRDQSQVLRTRLKRFGLSSEARVPSHTVTEAKAWRRFRTA